eukprot:Nk52_evm5s2133 gene=Nk52_evmTU5s2133
MTADSAMKPVPPYPLAKRTDVVEDFHGVKVEDPYRWLEDPDSVETKQWINDQVAYTESYLQSFAETKKKISAKLAEILDFPRRMGLFKRGTRYFHYRNDGLQNQNVLFSQENITGISDKDVATVILDPNTFADDGTASLKTFSASRDGKYMAYGVSYSGSDWSTIFIKDLENNVILEEKIEWSRYTAIAFSPDCKGFFYNCYDPPKGLEGKVDEDKGADSSQGKEVDSAKNQKIHYHVIGTDPKTDIQVFRASEDEPDYISNVTVSDCDRYVFLTGNDSCDAVNDLYFLEIENIGKKDFKCIVKERTASFSYLTTIGDEFYFVTNKDAPKMKLVKYSFGSAIWEDVIPESDTDVLDDVECSQHKYFICNYTKDVKSVLKVFNVQGEYCRDIELPMAGTISSLDCYHSSNEVFFSWSSYLHASVCFVADTNDFTVRKVHENKPKGFDAEQFVVKQEFYASKDGTRIPMYLVHHKDIVMDGENPCLLYGYGGFNISLMPAFNSTAVLFANNFRGVYVVANLRGGGEYGIDWYHSGRQAKKQNVFDDFQWAAKYLTERKYTNSKKIIIEGGSNGGLLVGACFNQAPELFGCALSHVGVHDIYRFHKFTIGYAWKSDYGCSEDAEDFRMQRTYSPLHNVDESKTDYPPIMLITADHDDRVVPLHSFKFAAELQYKLGRDKERHPNPCLIKIEKKAGHGAGKPITKIIDSKSDCYAFAACSVSAQWHC